MQIDIDILKHPTQHFPPVPQTSMVSLGWMTKAFPWNVHLRARRTSFARPPTSMCCPAPACKNDRRTFVAW